MLNVKNEECIAIPGSWPFPKNPIDLAEKFEQYFDTVLYCTIPFSSVLETPGRIIFHIKETKSNLQMLTLMIHYLRGYMDGENH